VSERRVYLMEFQKYLVYSASAGSGKTFALSLRYVSLLFFGESPSNILATTFTRKAASQMQSRVRDYLLNLQREKEFLLLLSEETGLTMEEILRKREEVLDRFLSSTNYIVTIDSFISSILRTNALEIELEPNFNTVDDGVDLEVEFLKSLYKDGLLDEFVNLTISMEQKRGSGAINIMGELFTIDPLLPPKPKKLEREIEKVERYIDMLREKNFTLLKSLKASKSAILNFAPIPLKKFVTKTIFNKKSLHDHRLYTKILQKAPEIEKNYQEIRESISDWMNIRESLILARLFKLYYEYRDNRVSKAKSTSTLTFSDVTYFAYRLLYKGINRDFLYFKLDSKFKHILLDEFQDTSTVQFLIFKPLIDEIFSGIGNDEFRTFFYVGDPKQSLYRFRGGQEELFEWVAKEYNITVRELDTNYRSGEHIVKSVNRWFDGVMPLYTPQRVNSQRVGYVKVLESEEGTIEAIREAKRLISLGVDRSSITFLVFTNNEGVDLQNLALQESLPTILQTSSKLNRLSKVLALTQACEYLYRGHRSDLYNLLLRVGVKEPKEVDFGWFNLALRPVELIDKLIRSFDYFDDEVNLLNLLEFASKYDEIGEFLDEFEKSRVPIATKSKYGATIMTIHNSKGLEFDYVIVLDKRKKDRVDSKFMIPKYDENLYIERFFYRFAKRENFDSSYRDLVEYNRDLSKKDRLNLLYVALTRAKKGLIVVKNLEKSVFDEELNISPVELGTVDRERAKIENVTSLTYPSLSRYGVQEVQKSKPKKKYDYQATLFGTALHYTLEMMRNFDKNSLNLAMDATKHRFGVFLSDEELADIDGRVSKLIKSRRFRELIEGRKILKEQPVSYQGSLYQIDLLLESDDIFVVDYKSSQAEIYLYKKQLSNYCEIVSNITKKRAKGFICFLLKDKIEIKRVVD
jgi:exodeoxyribonuclease V beta subunit